MQWGQSFLIPLIQQSGVCHHLQKPVARVDPPISRQRQKIIHINICNWSFPSVCWEDWQMQMLLTVFSLPFMNIHSNRLTRPQNEVQISSVWTSGPARPLIPACSSLTLVFPVYRRNGEEYSPQYPHHWEAVSHSRAADKPKETFSELHTIFYLFLVELPVEGSSGLSLGSLRKLWESVKALYVLPAVPLWVSFSDPWVARWPDARSCIQICLSSSDQLLQSKFISVC